MSELAAQLTRLRRRGGRLPEDPSPSDPVAGQMPLLARYATAAIQKRVATGPRAGQPCAGCPPLPQVGDGAVIGRRFEFALLQRASGLGDDEAADGMEDLVRRRILEQAGGGFEFTHDQIREVRHADPVAPLRALLHRRVAHAMEPMQPSDARRHALALGTRYREAGEWAKAVTHRPPPPPVAFALLLSRRFWTSNAPRSAAFPGGSCR